MGPTANASKKASLTALLGSGFDAPGVTNVFCAYAQKHLFDSIETNRHPRTPNAGETTATTSPPIFNPEIQHPRDFTQNGRYWEAGEWKEVEPMSVHQGLRLPPVVGKQDAYLLYHEELESLCPQYQGPQTHPFLG